ncbi:hypothetical protein PUN28_017731 [Cardiocondyla obscurior]|uniref:Uncharacterized protein n=1 Tax=Cardiocondyla obscurior TaxID=286306 RepID=A0AAW2EIV7_9HYME
MPFLKNCHSDFLLLNLYYFPEFYLCRTCLNQVAIYSRHIFRPHFNILVFYMNFKYDLCILRSFSYESYVAYFLVSQLNNFPVIRWKRFTKVSIDILTMSLLQVHCIALFPYSTHLGAAKFVDSAQLNP